MGRASLRAKPTIALLLPRGIVIQPIELIGAVLAEVLLRFGGALGVFGQAALQFLPPALVAALLMARLSSRILRLSGSGILHSSA